MVGKRRRLTGAVDRISDLPEPIIHQILWLLPGKDVIRICLLSKSLLSALTSFPVLDLDYSWFEPDQTDRFLDYVSYSTQRFNITHTGGLAKFKIHAKFSNPEQARRIVEAIEFAIKNGVKLLDINFVSRLYSLPQTIRFARSITTLNLTGMRLKNLNKDMMVFWSVLENLCIRECSGLQNFEFSSGTIKSVFLQYCVGLKSINIQSSSLQSLAFTGKLSESCDIDVSECKFIKVLWLASATMNDWVEENIPKLKHLEELKLIHVQSRRLETLVCSQSLKRLQYETWTGSVKIQAMNLESLIYNGFIKYSSSFSMSDYTHLKHLSMTMKMTLIPDDFIKKQVHNFVGLGNLELEYDTSCELKKMKINRQKNTKLLDRIDQMVQIIVRIPASESLIGSGQLFPLRDLFSSTCLIDLTLSLGKGGTPNHHNFITLWNWIASFGKVNTLTLACNTLKDLFSLEQIKPAVALSPIYDLKHLTVKLSTWTSISPEMIDCLLWPSPNLETLCFHSHGLKVEKRTIQFHYGSRIATKEDVTCCRRLSMRCWRHSLQNVALKNFDVTDQKELTKYFSENRRKLQFRFM